MSLHRRNLLATTALAATVVSFVPGIAMSSNIKVTTDDGYGVSNSYSPYSSSPSPVTFTTNEDRATNRAEALGVAKKDEQDRQAELESALDAHNLEYRSFLQKNSLPFVASFAGELSFDSGELRDGSTGSNHSALASAYNNYRSAAQDLERLEEERNAQKLILSGFSGLDDESSVDLAIANAQNSIAAKVYTTEKAGILTAIKNVGTVPSGMGTLPTSASELPKFVEDVVSVADGITGSVPGGGGSGGGSGSSPVSTSNAEDIEKLKYSNKLQGVWNTQVAELRQAINEDGGSVSNADTFEVISEKADSYSSREKSYLKTAIGQLQDLKRTYSALVAAQRKESTKLGDLQGEALRQLQTDSSATFDDITKEINKQNSLKDLHGKKRAEEAAASAVATAQSAFDNANVFDPKNDAGQQVGTGEQNRISSTDSITVDGGSSRSSDGSVTLTVDGPELSINRSLYTQTGISFTGAGQASTKTLDSSAGNITTDGVAVTVGGSMNAAAGSVEAKNSGSFTATGDITAASVKGTNGGKVDAQGNITATHDVTSDGPNSTIEGQDITAASVKGTNGGKVEARGKIEADTVSGHVRARTGINGGDASLPETVRDNPFMTMMELGGVHSAKVEGGSHIVVTHATAETHHVSGVGESGNLAEHYEVNNAGSDDINHGDVYSEKTILRGNNSVGTLEGDEAIFSRKDSYRHSNAAASVDILKVRNTKVESGTTLNISAVEERVSGEKNLLHGDGSVKLKTLDSVQLGASNTTLGKAILGEGKDSLSLSGEHYVDDVELAAKESRVATGQTFKNYGYVINKSHLIVEGEFFADKLEGDDSTSAVTYQSKGGATIDYDISGHKEVTFAGQADAEEPTTFTVTSGTIGADVVSIGQSARTIFDSNMNVWGKIDNAGVVDINKTLKIRDGFENKAGAVTDLRHSVDLNLDIGHSPSSIFDNQLGARLNVYGDGRILGGNGLKNAGDIHLTNGEPLTVGKAFTIVGTEGQVFLGKIDSYGTEGLIMTVGTLEAESDNAKLTIKADALMTEGSVQIKLTGGQNADTVMGKLKHLFGTGNRLIDYNFSYDGGSNKILMTAEEDSEAATKLGLNPNAVGGLLAGIRASLDEQRVAAAYRDLLSSGDEGMRIAAEQSTSTAATASTQAGIAAGRASTGAVSTRLASLRQGGVQLADLEGNSGVSSGDEIRRNGMWLKGSGSLADQGRRSGLAGYNSHTRGMTLGVDNLAADDLRIGFALSTAQSKVKSKGADKTKTDVMSYQFATYGSYEPGPYFVEGQVAYALNNTDTKRTVVGGDTATGDFKARQYTASLGAGVPFGFADGITLTPKAGLFYSRTKSNAYTETGPSSQNLTVTPEATQILEANLGATLAYEHVNLDGSMFRPELRAAALYEFLGEKGTATAKYSGAGATVKTPGAEPAKFGGTAGLGIAYTTADGQWEVRADYDAEIRQDYISHNGMLTGRLNF